MVRNLPVRLVMSSSDPYRVAPELVEPGGGERGPCDGDVLGGLVFLWVVSWIRVGAALWTHERMGAEPSLAWLAVVMLPCVARSSLADVWRRWRKASVNARAAGLRSQ